ncbi:MAG: hypothetical protein AAB480_03495 [Patescibacteria group bacterium]
MDASTVIRSSHPETGLFLQFLQKRFPKVKPKELQSGSTSTSGKTLSRGEVRVRNAAHALWTAEEVLKRRNNGLGVPADRLRDSLYRFVIVNKLLTRREVRDLDRHSNVPHEYNDDGTKSPVWRKIWDYIDY